MTLRHEVPKCDPPGSVGTALDVNIETGKRQCGMGCEAIGEQPTVGKVCPTCLHRWGWFQLMTSVTALGNDIRTEKELERFVKRWQKRNQAPRGWDHI